MDLIDRYLVAVRRHLPRPLQKDVVQEFADVQWSLVAIVIICLTDVLVELWHAMKARRELPV